jgi:hypothetical protein
MKERDITECSTKQIKNRGDSLRRVQDADYTWWESSNWSVPAYGKQFNIVEVI